MKIFQVTLDFKLQDKPSWLDSFRKKFDKPYEYHITLKYPTYIKEEDINDLKEEVAAISDASSRFVVEFNGYFFDKTDTGEIIMVKAKQNEDLVKLQKEIIERLKKYGSEVKAFYQKFENNFRPHITIARKLDDNLLRDAKKELKEHISCTAEIDSLSLTIYNDTGASVNEKKENTLHYPLKRKF